MCDPKYLTVFIEKKIEERKIAFVAVYFPFPHLPFREKNC
jgi:hypothetical protein